MGPRSVRRAWGVVGVEWGRAAIDHAMRLADSADMAMTLRTIIGDDHRENLDAAFASYVQQMKALRDRFVPDYGFLLSAPILLDSDLKIEKSLISSAKKKVDVDDWFMTVEKPEYKAQGVVKGDLSMLTQFSGDCLYRENFPSSPLNNTLHQHQATRCAAHFSDKSLPWR